MRRERELPKKRKGAWLFLGPRGKQGAGILTVSSVPVGKSTRQAMEGPGLWLI